MTMLAQLSVLPLRPHAGGNAWARRLLGIALLLLLLLAGRANRAQAQAPSTGGPTPAAPTDTPLDGGASLLLAGGIGYALRRLRRRPAP